MISIRLLSVAVMKILALTFLFSTPLDANELQGKVIDQSTGNPLVGANITLVELNRGTASDRNGFFKIDRIPEGTYELRVQFVGYATVTQTVTVPLDETLYVELVERAFEIDEVIVTATPLGSAVRYQAAQSLQGDALHRLTASSIGEMLEFEPGIAMRSFGSAPARPVIRGLDGDRVLVLENGERMGDLAETAHDHAIAMDPLAAHRIEIVRGPASLLYGSSALGGVINIFNENLPRNWTSGFSGAAALYASSMNNGGAGYSRFVYGTSQWASTVSASYRESGDIRTPTGILPGTSIRNVTGSGGVGYRGDRLYAAAAVSYLDNVYGLPEALDDPDEEIEIRMNRLAIQAKTEMPLKGFFRNAELRFSGARYSHQEIEIEYENGTPEEEVELDFRQQSVSSTITFIHNPIGFLSEGAIGSNVVYRDMNVGGLEALTPDGRSFSAGLFVFQEAPLSEVIRLQLGSRLELHRFTARPNDKFPNVTASRSSATFSGSAGLHVRPSSGVEIGFQIARAHRTPTIEELFSDAPHLGTGAYEVGDISLRNEIGHGFDIFAHYTGERVRMEVAGFYNNIMDFIFLQPTGDTHEPSGLPVFRYVADDVILLGGELGIASYLVHVIRFEGHVSYVRGSRRGDSAEPLPFIPPLRGKIGLLYDVRTWWVGSTIRWANAQERVAANEEPTVGYVLTDLEFGYRMNLSGRHLIVFRLENMFNTVYRDHLSRVKDRDNPMPGRNATLVYRWYF